MELASALGREPSIGIVSNLAALDPNRPLPLHEPDVQPRSSCNVRLLNHLVRTDQKRLRDGDAERLGRLEIDHKLQFGRPLNWEVTGFRAFVSGPQSTPRDDTARVSTP